MAFSKTIQMYIFEGNPNGRIMCELSNWNGKAIKITCEKTSRSAQTVYKDLDGNEIKVNDGNTYVQICPINAKVTIEGAEETVTEDVD